MRNSAVWTGLILLAVGACLLVTRTGFAQLSEKKRNQWEYGILELLVTADNNVKPDGKPWIWTNSEGYTDAKSAVELCEKLHLKVNQAATGRNLEIAVLNALGSDAWELVGFTETSVRGVSQTSHWHFKRSK
jgi:hypothetical protein